MKKNLKLLIIFLIIPILTTSAQEISPKKQVDTMLKKAWECYEQSKFRCMAAESKKVVEYAKKHNIPKGIAEGYYYLGIAYYSMGNLAEAIKYANKSIDYAKDKGNYKWLAYSYTLLGEIFKSLKKYDEAYFYFQKSFDLSKQNNNKKMMIVAYSNIGNLFFEKGNLKKAQQYYEKAYQMLKIVKTRDSYVALINYNLGIALYRQKKFKDAIPYLEKASNIYKKLSDVPSFVNTIYFLAKTYKKTGQEEKAKKILRENLEYAKKIKLEYKFLKLLKD